MPKGASAYNLVRKNLLTLFLLALLIPIYFILYKIYIPHVNAFGCFDDCFNFIGGYFLLQGKSIYQDFFYNHQPMAAYLSFLIQALTAPQNIFELVLRHRQFMILFGLIMNAILILRFKIPALLFVVLFEFSKFYIFGDRFLSEGMVVYPLVYTAGVIFLKLSNYKPVTFDYFLIPVFAWFVVFSREPFAPLALLLLATFLFEKSIKKINKPSILIFTMLSAIAILTVSLRDYFFNVVTINALVALPNQVKGQIFGGPVEMFFYPLFIFASQEENVFKTLLIGVNAIFIILFLKLVFDRKYMLALFIFLTLGFANLKPNVPGKVYYEAFHMIPWTGLFIFITTLLVFREWKNRKLFIPLSIVLFLITSLFIFSPQYFAREKVDTHAEFLTGYGPELQEGEVVKTLSNETDTLFLDGSHDLIYWQSGRSSSYKYSWYTSFMPSVPEYAKVRDEMFKNSPPDFYREHGICPKKIKDVNLSLPDFVKNQYVPLETEGNPSCIYVHKDKLNEITSEQWKKAAEWRYNLPNEEN